MCKKLQFSFLLFGFLFLTMNCSLVSSSSNSQVTFTGEQTAKLLERIEEKTPEHTHLIEGATFSWVCLVFKGNFSLSLMGKIIEHFRDHYTVYTNAKDIPSEKIRTSNGKWIGYKDGFLFVLDMKYIDINTIEIEYTTYVGNMGSSGRRLRYFWNGKDWEESALDRWIS